MTSQGTVILYNLDADEYQKYILTALASWQQVDYLIPYFLCLSFLCVTTLTRNLLLKTNVGNIVALFPI